MTLERERWVKRAIFGLVVAHIAALVFGLAGLLIAVPNPHLWADSETGVRVYQFGMQYAGATHILFAAGVMLLAGFLYLGARKTLTFFVIACSVSLAAELIGTTTGFPFGEYRYTSGLGYQILGEVPFTIPLSWFYMGLASYLLAVVLVGTGPGWRRPVLAVVTGAALLTVWDLVLDPAMAHQQLDVRFWIWDQGGLYFDMPAQNFLGWMLTGTVFIGMSRIFWGEESRISAGAIRVSFLIYLANLIFAMVISAAVGLWWPIVITVFIGVIPALAALVAAEESGDDRKQSSFQSDEDTIHRVSRGVLRILARFALAREANVQVSGASNVPSSGPAVLVCRHYHHLLDGCALVAEVPRSVHLLVATDWAGRGQLGRLLDFACQLARWPKVIRPASDNANLFTELERRSILRQALVDSVELLAEGRLLAVFPEGYPTIDPHGTGNPDPESLLAFDPGFMTITRAAERRTGYQIPLVPVGFHYRKSDSGTWEIDMRLGAPIVPHRDDDAESVAANLRARVETLSQPAESPMTADAARLTETS